VIWVRKDLFKQVIISTVYDIKKKQETQLSLTNHATRLEVSQGHQTWYYSIC